MKNNCKLFINFIFLLFTVTLLHSATITSNTSGNWNSTGTWIGGVVPGSGDDVIIGLGHTITVTENASCNSISFSNNNSSGTGTITVNNGIILNAAGSINAPGISVSVKISATYTLTGSGTINCGSLNVGNAQLPGGSGSTTIYLTSTIANLNVSGNLKLTATFASGGSKYNNPFLDLQSGTIKVSGQIVSDNQQSGAISTITSRNGTQSGTLILKGEDPFNISPIGTTIIYLDGASTTVDYSRNGNQIVYPTTYKNLSLTGSGTKTTTGVVVDGKFVIYGDVDVTDTPDYSTPPTMEYTGTAAISTGSELPDTVDAIIINNSAGVTLSKTITASTITIGNDTLNSILNDGGYQINSTGTLNLTSGAFNIGSTFPSFASKVIGSGTSIGYTGNGNQTVVSDIDYENLTLGGSGTKTTIGVSVNGRLKMSGSASVSDLPNYGVSSSIEYNGSGAQNSGNELPDNVRYLVINNTGGDVNLIKEITVNETLEFVSGNLKHNNGLKLVLGNSAMISGETGGNSFIGNLQKGESIGTSSSSASLNSLGISIEAGEDLGTITVLRTTGISAAGFDNSILRSWKITSDKSPSTGRNISLEWVSSEDNSIDLFHAVVYRSTNNGSSWSACSEPTGTDASSDRTLSAVNILPGTITVGDVSLPLPVELTSFNAQCTVNSAVPSGRQVELKWETATEVNNYGFEILRRSASQNDKWETIGFIEGAGNSNTVKSYSFTDNLTLTSYSYRLKQIDLDGKFTYSKEVEVSLQNIPSEFALEQNYPNPFNPTTTIKYSVPNASLITLHVFNLLGQEVATLVNEQQPAGNYEVKFDASNLSSGIYLYKIQVANPDGSGAGDFTSVKKLILMK